MIEFMNRQSTVPRYCVQGDVQRAMQLLAAMRERGIRPDGILYNSLLDGCVRALVSTSEVIGCTTKFSTAARFMRAVMAANAELRYSSLQFHFDNSNKNVWKSRKIESSI